MTSSIIQLECQCNNYPWGKKGKDSLAARYAAATPGGSFELDEKKEYAEVGISHLKVLLLRLWSHLNNVLA